MSVSAMKQALEALEEVQRYDKTSEWFEKKVSALRQAIEQAEKQEPVVGTKTWFEDGKMVTQHLYASDISQERVDETAKRKHEWVGLTDEEREAATGWSVEHIEAKLKEKNA